MKKLIYLSIIFVLLVGLIPQATAIASVITLWEQLPDGTGEVLSNMDNIFYADDFVLTAASSITQIEIWNGMAEPVDIYYYIHANTLSGGYNIPGESIDSGIIKSSVTLEGSSICPDDSCQYRHTINLSSPLELAAGHYWLEVLGWYGSNFSWSYGFAPTDYPTYAWTPLPGPWDGTSAGGLAFRLLGPAPCSSSIEVQNANDSGTGSLREAIVDVCPGGVISFNPSLSGATITLSSQLILDKDLVINGSDLDEMVSLSGNDSSRVILVDYGSTVTLDSLVITHGKNDNGGGIYNGGTLTINNSSLLLNMANIGGGIDNNGTLSIINSTFSQNNAANGAALVNWETATLAGCTISENQAEAGAGIDLSGGTLTVTDSTFSGNTATQRGGGIMVNLYTQAIISGTTFINNTAGDMGGGGILNMGTTSVVNSTFTGNETKPKETVYVYGSAINNYFGNLILYNSTLSGNTGYVTLNNQTGSLSLANTIIANTIGGWDCSTWDGTLTQSINNWVSDGDTSGADSCGATLFGDPNLGALADNGGTTHTMALQEGSPAINAGDDTICAGTLVGGVDQRGIARPQGGACDIGAFELEIPYLWQQLPGGESQVASYNGSTVAYEDFVLTQSATIRQVEFWSSTADPAMIYFGYYKNTTDGSGNDIPGDMISSYGNTSTVTEEDPLICSQSYCAYRHSFSDDTTLDPGHYWIRIHGDSELYWSSAADMSGSYAYYPDGATSPTLGSGNLAFRLLEYINPKITSISIDPTFPGMPTWINVNFTDPDSSSHTAAVDWGDEIIDDADYCGYDYCNFPEHIYTEAGTYTVQVWVTDGEGHTGTVSTLYVVSYVMVPTYLEDRLASDTETTIIEIDGAAVEGHYPLNFSIVTNPEQHGTFGIPSSSVCEFDAEWGAAICRASVVYTPPTETYLGYDNFSYTVDDGQGNVSPAATVPLYVAPNTPPTAQDSSASVSTILPSTIMLTATDPDFYNDTIDRLSAFIGTGPTQGTLGDIEKENCYLEEPEVGEPYGICYFEVEYTPNQEITGKTDSFTFSVFDTHQYSLPGTISIELHAPVTWTVNATDDVVDEFGCDETHCSLREAVDAAWPGDIIEFDLTTPDIIVLDGNDILIDKSLVINGPGADLLAISGGAEIEDLEPWTHDRVFTIGQEWEGVPVTVIINDLTIRDGRSISGGGVAVNNGSSLTMNDCVIGPNNIVTYAGGGVFNDRAHLTLNRCTVTGNEGTGSLGGAGVTTAYSGATTTLINSTVSGNITNNFGGGLFVGPECVVSLINTTVSGNISNANYLEQYEERGGGAGIYIESGEYADNLVYLQNSIIAGNTDMTDPATAGHEKWPDIYGEVTSLGGNLIGDPTGSTNTWDASDQVGSAVTPLDPMLGELMQNNPGKTLTMALLESSPAIDAVTCLEGIDVDQRGVTRPQGSACDIGAYELEQAATTGQLKISKIFDPLTSNFSGNFSIMYYCDEDYWAYISLSAGGSETITGIPIGSHCTVSEPTLPTPPTGWSFGPPSFSPSDGIVTISETLAEVTVTNTISENIPVTGELKITKVFEPLTSGFIGDFSIAYDCNDGTTHDGSVSLSAGGSQNITGIPIGTQCTVTETTLPTPPTGWSFGTPTYYPETGVVTITEASPAYAEVTVTNSISRDTGVLTISKSFDPLTSGFNGTFAINYDCDDGTTHDGIANLAAGATETITGIPTGTQCTVTEPTLPTAPTGWTFGTPTFSPESGIVTIPETESSYMVILMVPVGAEVTVTNSISRDLGELWISKVFDPLTSGFSGDFTITYDCEGTDHDGTVTLAAGGSETISGIPTDTQCTVTEPTLPTPPTGWSFGTPSFSPLGGIVTISETIAEVTVTNTISRDLGELKISKVFDAGDSGFTGTFVINYDCDDGEAYDGTVNLAAGGTKTISGIPTGTQCTVTETTLPTPPTGWSFGTPTYTPTDGTVTISETLAEVVVTNTIRQDVVSDLSQLTTAKTTCIQFSSGLAPDLERLLYTPTYNKKTGDYVIKSVTPSSFLYYVKAILPADASTLVIAQENRSGFPAMLPSVTLYDGNCVRLSPTLASVTINSGNITINFTPGEDQRIIYAGVKYSARPVIGQVVNAYPDIDYSFSAALDGAAAYTSDDLSITFIQ